MFLTHLPSSSSALVSALYLYSDNYLLFEDLTASLSNHLKSTWINSSSFFLEAFGCFGYFRLTFFRPLLCGLRALLTSPFSPIASVLGGRLPSPVCSTLGPVPAISNLWRLLPAYYTTLSWSISFLQHIFWRRWWKCSNVHVPHLCALSLSLRPSLLEVNV